MLKAFLTHIGQSLPFLKEGKLLIAISGGVDSVVMTHLCKQINLDISLAHCNFNLRGKESDADENFVLQFSEDLELECFIENFDTNAYAKEHKLSTQMAARELRYSWFNELSEQLGFDYVLTAHHADDNLETFLINLSRGTGIEGLTGIPVINNNLVRPLLPFSREVIEVYAKDNNLSWREDVSNTSVKYLRNKLRLEVIPILKGINPQLLHSFNKTIEHLKESQQIIEDRVDDVLYNIVEVKPNGIFFDIKKLKELENPKAYLYEILKYYEFTEWDDVTNLLDAQSGKQVFSKKWCLLKDREMLILSKINTNDFIPINIIEGEQKVAVSGLEIQFEQAKEAGDTTSQTIFVDKDLLKFPLTIRQWQEGDYFYPLGMKGKKKLSKYFKDEKLSLIDKESVLLLCSGKEIVWIINRRADNRFKVSANTKQIIKIELQ